MSEEREVPKAAPAPEGALCALHPTTAADGICARCGNYMCAYCSERGTASECLACRARAGAGGFLFDRSNWSVFALLDYAWQVFRHYWLKLTLLSGAMLIATQGIGLLFGAALGFQTSPRFDAQSMAIRGIAFALQTMVGVAGGLAQYQWALRAIDGQPLEVDDLLRALRRWPQALLATAIIMSPFGLLAAGAALTAMFVRSNEVSLVLLGGAVGVLVILITPVLIYSVLGVAFVTVALVHDPALDAWGAIRESWEIAAGRRWRLLGAMFLFVAICIAGVMLCFIGLIPATAYASLALACMYNALRKKETSR